MIIWMAKTTVRYRFTGVGGSILWPKPCVLNRSRCRTAKNTVFYSAEWTCWCMRPPGTGKTKVKKETCFFDRGGSFCDLGSLWRIVFAILLGRKSVFYSVFVRCVGLMALRENVTKNSPIAVFPATMLVKTSQIAVIFFETVFKRTVSSGVLGHGQLKNIDICSGFWIPNVRQTIPSHAKMRFDPCSNHTRRA